MSSLSWSISSSRSLPSLVARWMGMMESTSSSLNMAWHCGWEDLLDSWRAFFPLDGFFTCVQLGSPFWSILLGSMLAMPHMNHLGSLAEELELLNRRGSLQTF